MPSDGDMGSTMGSTMACTRGCTMPPPLGSVMAGSARGSASMLLLGSTWAVGAAAVLVEGARRGAANSLGDGVGGGSEVLPCHRFFGAECRFVDFRRRWAGAYSA